jgi:hypothetical protein
MRREGLDFRRFSAIEHAVRVPRDGAFDNI